MKRSTTSPSTRLIRDPATGLRLIARVLPIAGIIALILILDPWIGAGSGWRVLIANLLPALLIVALGFGLFRRLWPASLLTAAVLAVLFYINDLKVQELDQPLFFSDLFLLGQVFGNLGLFVRYSHGAILLVVALLIAAVVVLAWRREPPAGGWKPGLTVSLIAVAGLVFLAQPGIGSWLDSDRSNPTPWLPSEPAHQLGLLGSLTVAASADRHALPPQRPRDAEILRNRLAAGTRPAEGLAPDLVILLSESFFDPDGLAGVDGCHKLPAWCRMRERGIAGQLSAPTFGGNTTRTEFEVLTGVPYRLLPDGVYPYSSVVTRETASIGWALKSRGYRTLALHPHSGRFWQRDRALPLLGFDRFIAEEDFGPHERAGFYISDRSLTDRIIERLDEAHGAPEFVFAISMENHGPWHGHRPNIDPARLADMPTPDDLDSRGAHAWRQYLYHARNASRELERLADFINQRERPTLVLFFGDHLPGLHSVFDQLEFVDGEPAFHQPVPFVALANYPLHTPEWIPERTYQLPAWLLAAGRLPGPGIYRDIERAHHRAKTEPDGSVESGLSALMIEILHIDPREWFRAQD